MTEQEWFAKSNREIYNAIASLTPRRQRLLAAAVCHVLLPWINYPAVQNALDVIEIFADTEKTKAALYRARQAVLTTQNELLHLHLGQQQHDGVGLALSVVLVAASEDVVAGTIDDAITALALTAGIPEEESRKMLYITYCEIVGTSGHSVAFLPEWRTTTTVQLAQQMYESRNFSTMPILADALQDADCDNDDVLNHCRESSGVHVRGCWVLDLILSKDR
jgi:hypothetical protein